MNAKPATEATPEAPTSPPVAVIDIGSTSIRMGIGEVDRSGRVRTLDSLFQAVSLGKDAFTAGAIRKSTMEDCVRVLKSYRQILQQYDISRPDQIRVVATSAVREARNRLAFLDRVYIATGLEVEPIDEAEVTRITYMGIQPFLETRAKQVTARSIVTEVGGGSTELLLVRDKNVEFAHTYRLGSLRLRKTLEAWQTPSIKVRQILENQIRRTIDQIVEQVAGADQVEMIALGGDMRFAAVQILRDWDRTEMAHIDIEKFANFTNTILDMDQDAIVRKYHLCFPDAECVGPALLVNLMLARTFDLPVVHVTNTNLRDGLMQEMVDNTSWSEQFRRQIVRSAIDLGRKFDFEQTHAEHVAELSSKLFSGLQEYHGLPDRYETILYVAALLHEIGLFVGTRGYHKHSMYLINNSELFGLSKTDLMLVSLVARYHRRATPQPTHENYRTLQREQRIVISKLAAILRVAKTLDESRSQRIHDLQTGCERDRLVIGIPNVEDLSLEQMALKQNGAMFEEVFGLKVLLRPLRY